MSDAISYRELRGMVNSLDRTMSELKKIQDEQSKQIFELSQRLTGLGSDILQLQFYGNRLANAINEGRYGGAIVPVLQMVAAGVSRGAQVALEHQRLGEQISRGEIQFGTQADRDRFAWETTMNAMIKFVGL